MVASSVQSAVLPALHGSQAQFRRSAKLRAIARVTASNLQTCPCSLGFSGTHVSQPFFLGTGSILKGQAMRPARRKGRSVAVKAMFEWFTKAAMKAIMLAQEEARRLGHNFVGTEQLLLGLIGEGTGIAAKVLKSMGINLKDARVEVEKIIGRGSEFVGVEIPFTPRVECVFELSLEEARRRGHNYVQSGHLLLVLLRGGEDVAARVLESLGADRRYIHTQVIRMVRENTEAVRPTPKDYGNILTKLAEECSEEEFERIKRDFERFLKDIKKQDQLEE